MVHDKKQEEQEPSSDLKGLGPQGRRIRSTRHPGVNTISEETRTKCPLGAKLPIRKQIYEQKDTKRQKDEQAECKSVIGHNYLL